MTNMTQKMPKPVESFNLDHSKVRAPYVRLAGRHHTPHGDTISKFDLRFLQPNDAAMPTDAMHTIEHLLASYVREALGEDVVIDASPMGCRTGFYLITMGETAESDVRDAFRYVLSSIADYDGQVPGVSDLECGNYRDHSLEAARALAQEILTKDIIIQPTITLNRV
jgi:S-ribosylhomocysteine lyase